MAESDDQADEIIQQQGQSLRYLDFVQVAALQMVMGLTGLYDFAKESAGPLKPGVQSVEGTVKAVVGPVYERFQDVPFEILKVVDRKVDDSLHELERHVPSLVKEATGQVYGAAQRVPEVARSVAGEVQRSGVVATAAGMAKVAYAQYEPVAEQYAVGAWRWLNRLPLFAQVAQSVVPTAAYLSEKYNEAVVDGAERGCTMAAYLPLVPTERIATVFGCDNGSSIATEVPVAADE